MNKKARVVVAMSGGVDSSVAAALLKQDGYEVIGVTMQIWPSDKAEPETVRFGGCCGIGAVEDAKRVAYRLGIPHYVMNFREVFAQKVIADFCQEYRRGRTPNPCIRCNQHIKFAALLDRAKELGAYFVATGHYAIIDTVGGRYVLSKGADLSKDQSYVLYTLTQQQMERTLLPVGGLTKTEVRSIARELDLPVANRPESQEICFVPNDDYGGFLRERGVGTISPGPITDKRGKVLGQHSGIVYYTIGQRRGLGIGTAGPLYVTDIDPVRNVVVVGTKDETYRGELTASELNWITVTRLENPVSLKAKIRYRHPEAEAEIIPIGGEKVRVKFKEPQMAITPGQAVVFYEGNNVVGGGVIDRTD
ncbi:MAG: tRNA 2-thiouridine(34) synthase MnmA [Chloroflexi bacterium]|nr:tRNA 2-thiouridine(34) synthase MnmA [Chloroflexota bacterium]